jgi:hypothetical protein
MAALAAAEQTLRETREEAAVGQQALQTLADTMAKSESDTAQSVAEALEQGNYDQAAETLRQAGENPPGDPAQRQALSDSLNQAADELAQTDPDLARELQQAADSLESGDTETTQQALDQAADQLADAGQQTQTQQQTEQALENIDQARQELTQQQGESSQSEPQAQNQGEPQSQGESQGQTQSQNQGQSESPGQSQSQGEGQQGQSSPGQQGEGNQSAQTESQAGTGGGPDASPNEGGLEEYSSVYAPDHLGGEGGELLSPEASQNDNAGLEVGETNPNARRPIGEATVPYTEVYQEYRSQAATALENSRVPLSMRDYIRQYFGALEP